MNEFYIKPKIKYGENSITNIDLSKFKRICIATDKFMVESGLLKKITTILDRSNIEYKIFDEITPDPSTDVIKNGLNHIIETKPHALIAFGGGSVIDAAKAIIYFYLQAFKKSTEVIEKPYFIAIPTTAGTGSEVTSFSVITDSKNNVKIPLVDDVMIPNTAVLDPILTLTVPRNITAATSMDILTHGIESYISSNSNKFSNLYALNSIKLVSCNVFKCYNELSNVDYRENLLIASTMAGIAFNSSGLGITHSIAHSIGAKFHIPHGLANAIVLPHIIEFNGSNRDVRSKYSDILKELGVDGFDEGSSTRLLRLIIEEFNQNLNIPKGLSGLGIDKDTFLNLVLDLAKTSFSDTCTKTNPVDIDIDTLKEIIYKLY